MNCNKCGAEIHEYENFCRNCGNPTKQNVNSNFQTNQQKANKSNNTVNKGIEFIMNSKDYTSEYDPNDIASTKIISILSYFGILFLIPLIAKPESKFARFHVNQGLILFISGFILNAFSSITQTIIKPVFTTHYYGSIYVSPVYETISLFVSLAINIIILLWFVLGIINSLNGKAKELPIIGKFRIIK